MTTNFTTGDVLEFLDKCQLENPYFSFMDLENYYFHTANSRLTLYADDARWAIVFEKSCQGNRDGRISLELNFYGNCLQDLDCAGAEGRYPSNTKWIPLIDDDELEDITSDFEEISLAANSVIVRDQTVAIPTKLDGYAAWVPDIRNSNGGFSFNRPTYADLTRFLAYEYPELCRATDAEKRLCIPADLPEIMVLDEWHHRSYGYQDNGPAMEVVGDAPSSYETFRMLAEVLVTRDPSRFHPTLPPTNHWSNWPEAGGL